MGSLPKGCGPICLDLKRASVKMQSMESGFDPDEFEMCPLQPCGLARDSELPSPIPHLKTGLV